MSKVAMLAEQSPYWFLICCILQNTKSNGKIVIMKGFRKQTRTNFL